MRTLAFKSIFIILLTGGLLLFASQSKAQFADSLFNVSDTSAVLPLPPADTLIYWAQNHSPLLKQQDALIEKTLALMHEQELAAVEGVYEENL